MKPTAKKVVICGGVRTPIGHLGKSLAGYLPEDLMEVALRAVLQRTSLYPHAVDGVLVGWVGQGSHAPNIARVSALKASTNPLSSCIRWLSACISM
jgi:acetyl-CoA C-acetyltransferase